MSIPQQNEIPPSAAWVFLLVLFATRGFDMLSYSVRDRLLLLSFFHDVLHVVTVFVPRVLFSLCLHFCPCATLLTGVSIHILHGVLHGDVHRLLSAPPAPGPGHIPFFPANPASITGVLQVKQARCVSCSQTG